MRKRVEIPGERIFVFKIIRSNYYGMVRGNPYRVLAVPEDFTLHQFAEAINESFGFAFDHAFGFYSNLTRYRSSDEGYELFADDPDERWIEIDTRFGSVKKTRVNQVFTQLKKKMLYLFDYGAEWHFRVELIKIEPFLVWKPYLACIKSVGKAPQQYDVPDKQEELRRIDEDDK